MVRTKTSAAPRGAPGIPPGYLGTLASAACHGQIQAGNIIAATQERNVTQQATHAAMMARTFGLQSKPIEPEFMDGTLPPTMVRVLAEHLAMDLSSYKNAPKAHWKPCSKINAYSRRLKLYEYIEHKAKGFMCGQSGDVA